MPLSSQNVSKLKSQIKIFLIEDDPADQLLFKKHLKQIFDSPDQYELHTFSSFDENLKNKVQLIDPDIVFLDLSLPGFDGVETIHEARQILDKPIIVLTSNVDSEMAFQALRKGAQDYLVKDKITPDSLDRAMIYALQRFALVHNLSIAQKMAKLGSWKIDLGDNEIFCSEELNNLLGLNDKRVQTIALEQFYNFFSPATAAQLEFQIAATKKENVRNFSVILKRAEEDFYYEIKGELVEGSAQEIQGTLQDVTERIKLEKMKDEFVSTVSHELRTPLAILKGSIQNLRDGIFGDMTEDQLKCLKMASENTIRLSRIIDNLLDISRMESKEILVKNESLNAQQFLCDITKGFKNSELAEKLNLILHDIDSDLNIFVDKELIHQVILNLLSNAARYAKSNITVSTQVVDEFLQITVEDDGKGIPENSLHLIFDKFVQVNRDTTKGGYKGTGLGLAICKRIIESHRGKIWAEYKQDHGAILNFTVPIYNAAKVMKYKVAEYSTRAKKAKSVFTVLYIKTKDVADIEDLVLQINNSYVRSEDYVFPCNNKNGIWVFFNGNKSQVQGLLDRLAKNNIAIVDSRVEEFTADTVDMSKISQLKI